MLFQFCEPRQSESFGVGSWVWNPTFSGSLSQLGRKGRVNSLRPLPRAAVSCLMTQLFQEASGFGNQCLKTEPRQGQVPLILTFSTTLRMAKAPAASSATLQNLCPLTHIYTHSCHIPTYCHTDVPTHSHTHTHTHMHTPLTHTHILSYTYTHHLYIHIIFTHMYTQAHTCLALLYNYTNMHTHTLCLSLTHIRTHTLLRVYNGMPWTLEHQGFPAAFPC